MVVAVGGGGGDGGIVITVIVHMVQINVDRNDTIRIALITFRAASGTDNYTAVSTSVTAIVCRLQWIVGAVGEIAIASIGSVRNGGRQGMGW